MIGEILPKESSVEAHPIRARRAGHDPIEIGGKTLRRLGFLQIDPISTVAPPQYLVLWSRLGPYDRAELDRLLWEERSLVEIDAFVREHAESAYHPCGTARLGRRDDPMAVVDRECRVIGVEGLRVADASVMPTVPGGNTNLPCIMIGEKAADLIRGQSLPRAELDAA